jgi:hypothetical protein
MAMASLTVGRMAPIVAGAMALVSTVLAGATIWLMLTDPDAVTTALADGSSGRLLQDLLEVLGSAITRLLRWM